MKIGGIVHYVMRDGVRKGAHRPALVLGEGDHGLILVVFHAPQDHLVTGGLAEKMVWWECVRHDEEKKDIGTWHEIEPEETKNDDGAKSGD